MITLNNISLRRGQHLLLSDVNWTIYYKQRFGLIGANGSGKSSLFSLLLQELEPDLGDIKIPTQLTLAHVAQEHRGTEQTAINYVLSGDYELEKLNAELIKAEHNNDGHQIALIHARFSEIDAYTAKSRASQLLSGLGFSQNEQKQTISEFSGGWRMRLNLAKALMTRSDLLLLDEPTNHLDLDAVIWLQDWLQDYKGTLILISHDRDFLDHVVDHIAHISNQQLKVYTGNYSAFEKQRVLDLQIQQAQYEKQQKHIAHMQKFIDRFRAKASKARQAQSRIKALERMDIITAVHLESPFQFKFKEPKPASNPLISLKDIDIAYGEKQVLNDVNFNIAPSDRIALIGPNGAGKSSFIKLLAQELKPRQGTATFSTNLTIGYFAQHQIDHLILTASPLDHLKKIAPGVQEKELRTFLGGFDFTGNRIFEPIQHFSGGEKSRLALALIIWQRPNILLLDEPTNHLDLEVRNALSLALQEFQGALILVSHDRFLLRSTVDQLILVANHQLTIFEGDLTDYEKWLIQYRKELEQSERENKPKESRKEQRTLDAKERAIRKPLLQKIKKLEEKLEKLKEKATQIELKLQDQTLYENQNKNKLQEIMVEQAHITEEIKITEEAWLQASETQEQL